MDNWISRLPESVNRFESEKEIIFSTLKQSLDIPESYSDAPSIIHRPYLGTCNPTLDSDAVIKYLNHILLEENIDENKPTMSYDPIALRAAEKSFYEALCNNPSSPYHSNYSTDSTFGSSSDFGSNSSHIDSIANAQMDSYPNANPVPNICSSSGFFHAGNQLVTDFDKYHSADSFRRKKHNHPDESGLEEEERSSKHSAVYKEEVELSEVFDKVLLCTDDNSCPSGVSEGTQQKGSSGGKRRSKKKGEVVDLESLLTSCALSIAAADHMTAKEQLKKIRQHSSPTGDANQRLAHAFANALEARLAGTGTQLYSVTLAPNNFAASELLKSHLSALPPMRISIFFANKMIYEVASKTTSLHVIDFGIFYGIQWPTLIRDLSQRPGGPPKLRITGIELPQPGFRPAQMVEETGCRLAKYCERFGVPFEYNAITCQNWETIKIDDLKLVSGEAVAVNCLFRLTNLLDVRVDVEDSPRDAVLKLIREASPHIYVQTVLNGSHGSPFFVKRFREALFLYTALFDSFDATLPCDDQRLTFEQKFIGREIMNIIACEGMERIERPETYKQWQFRIKRAGFKPMPINLELVNTLSGKMKSGYHKDFMIIKDENWILQGWKGKILCGSSSWVPQ